LPSATSPWESQKQKDSPRVTRTRAPARWPAPASASPPQRSVARRNRPEDNGPTPEARRCGRAATHAPTRPRPRVDPCRVWSRRCH